MRFQAIEGHAGKYPVRLMCRVLRVSTSGYFAWRKRPESLREGKDRELLAKIRGVRTGRKQSYGSPRVARALRGQGTACSRHQVARVMRQAGIRAVQARKFKATTDSKHTRPVAENVLDRRFRPSAKNQAWVADITYVGTDEGWLYLATVMDLYSRRIIGWSMKDRMTQDLVLDAAWMAVGDRGLTSAGIHHSDRGSQYASEAYQRLLRQLGMTCSMSRKGNCYDNAVMESFFHTLKVECVHHQRYRTRAEARKDIFEYIEAFYNRERLHSSLGYLSPIEFEAQTQTT